MNVSPNFDEREAGRIDFLVLHYTGMRSAEAAIQRLCDPAAKVSAHYVLDEDGTLHALVAEENRAWHAGVSEWRGLSMLNDRSIGIEIVNPGHEWGYRPFPEAQIAALIPICQAILARHKIPSQNIVGHSDIAPDRKQDPGELFPWKRLAEAGIGLWTDALGPPGDLDTDLTAIGYPPAERRIAAFQRRFRPARVDNLADTETRARAAAIRALGRAAQLRADLIEHQDDIMAERTGGANNDHGNQCGDQGILDRGHRPPVGGESN